jgi:hypothetical protein
MVGRLLLFENCKNKILLKLSNTKKTHLTWAICRRQLTVFLNLN